MINVFISYCHINQIHVKYVEELLKKQKNVKINIDESKLVEGASIKSFMDSLKTNDLIVLIITNEYLHSRNCMYEISKLVETINYKEKVFPIICDNQIYDIEYSAQIMTYWENKEKTIEEEAKALKTVNTGALVDELQVIQDIQRSLGEVLPFLRDRNNTDVNGVEEALNNKLGKIEKLDEAEKKQNVQNKPTDFFSRMNLSVPQQNLDTDLARNQFLEKAYFEIIIAMDQMLSGLSKRRNDISVVKRNDGVYELYKNGNLLKYIAISNVGQGMFSDCIALSAERFLTRGSCNEQYRAIYKDGKYMLEGMFSYSSTKNGYFHTADEVVMDIFNRFIKPDIAYN